MAKDKKEISMKPEKKVVLWSQPIITGRRIGNDLENGEATLLVANVSKRSIVVHHEIYDRNGAKFVEGYATVSPGSISITNGLNGTGESRTYAYCKLWFNGTKNEIRASLIMSTIQGPAGSETIAPVYGMSLS
jgi:hypothetical protein